MFERIKNLFQKPYQGMSPEEAKRFDEDEDRIMSAALKFAQENKEKLMQDLMDSIEYDRKNGKLWK